MLAIIFRYLKRLAVLLPVMAVGYLSIFNIFPELSERLPLLIAAIITYVLGAYILVPGLIRLARIAFPTRQLPLYCVTADGFASDPLNIALIGTRQQVISAMQQAQWQPAERLSPASMIRMAISVVYKLSYPNAPMSNLYLFGRKQDLAFQSPHLGNAESRHHVRFWAASFDETSKMSVRSINWRDRQAHVRDDALLWLGAASLDIGLTFTRHNAQITHLVHTDTDAERDLIEHDLLVAKVGKLTKIITLTQPYRLVNVHALRGHINTDAKLKVIRLTAKTMGSNLGSPKSKRQRLL